MKHEGTKNGYGQDTKFLRQDTKENGERRTDKELKAYGVIR
jgi:hypothetical protein